MDGLSTFFFFVFDWAWHGLDRSFRPVPNQRNQGWDPTPSFRFSFSMSNPHHPIFLPPTLDVGVLSFLRRRKKHPYMGGEMVQRNGNRRSNPLSNHTNTSNRVHHTDEPPSTWCNQDQRGKPHGGATHVARSRRKSHGVQKNAVLQPMELASSSNACDPIQKKGSSYVSRGALHGHRPRKSADSRIGSSWK